MSIWDKEHSFGGEKQADREEEVVVVVEEEVVR